MLSRRLFLFLAFFLVGCTTTNSPLSKLNIGVVNIEETESSLEPYLKLKNYLSNQLNSIVELEPTYNERKAIEEIKRRRWDLVFAPSGIAAIAIAEFQYRPIFPLEGGLKNRSAIVVLKDSPLSKLSDLNGKVIALGQPGSATGYYLPIYNLYGLTLAEVRLAATPKKSFAWLVDQEVDASAMSVDEFNDYRSKFPKHQFRLLHTDSHDVPSGAVLVSPNIEANQQKKIIQAMITASPTIAASARYLSNAPVPDYNYLIKIVKRVSPLRDEIEQKPVKLYY